MPGQIAILKIKGMENLKVKLKELLMRVDINTPIVLAQAGQVGVSYCKINCPVDTGRLRGSIGNPMKEGIFDVTRNSVAFGTAVYYAFDQEFGTAPYLIEPGSKGFLAWKDKATGKYIYTKKAVHHPAMPGRHYMLTGVQAAVPSMIGVLTGVLKG